MKSRISIASCVNRIINTETEEVRWFGFANKGAYIKNRTLLFSALAGGALAWPKGEEHLVRLYQADFCDAEREDGGVDLRFFVPMEMTEMVLCEFIYPREQMFEHPLDCIKREVVGELATAEIKGLQDNPVLKNDDIAKISFNPVGSYRQPLPEDGVGSSANATDVVTYRFFYFFDMKVPNEIWSVLQKSKICRFFSNEEAAMTGGGCRKITLPDSSIIGDNIILL